MFCHSASLSARAPSKSSASDQLGLASRSWSTNQLWLRIQIVWWVSSAVCWLARLSPAAKSVGCTPKPPGSSTPITAAAVVPWSAATSS